MWRRSRYGRIHGTVRVRTYTWMGRAKPVHPRKFLRFCVPRLVEPRTDCPSALNFGRQSPRRMPSRSVPLLLFGPPAGGVFGYHPFRQYRIRRVEHDQQVEWMLREANSCEETIAGSAG